MPLFVQQLIRGFPAFRCCYTGEWLLYPNNDTPAGLSCFRALGFHLSWINLDNSGRQRRPIISACDTLIFFPLSTWFDLLRQKKKKNTCRNPGKVTISGISRGKEKLGLLIHSSPFIFTVTKQASVFTRVELVQNAVYINLRTFRKMPDSIRRSTNRGNFVIKEYFDYNHFFPFCIKVSLKNTFFLQITSSNITHILALSFIIS